MDGEREARALGFESFNAFLKSKEMSALISMQQTLSGGEVFIAVPNEANIRHRMEHWESELRKLEKAAKTSRREVNDGKQADETLPLPYT